jgi:hypothetical protein
MRNTKKIETINVTLDKDLYDKLANLRETTGVFIAYNLRKAVKNFLAGADLKTTILGLPASALVEFNSVYDRERGAIVKGWVTEFMIWHCKSATSEQDNFTVTIPALYKVFGVWARDMGYLLPDYGEFYVAVRACHDYFDEDDLETLIGVTLI